MNLHSYEETYSVGNANDTNNDDDDDIDDDGDKEGLLARQEHHASHSINGNILHSVYMIRHTSIGLLRDRCE